MTTVPLPTRVGPKHGSNAFTPTGERQIYAAVRVHRMHPFTVAAQVGVTVPTIYAIVRRVEKELVGARSEPAIAPPRDQNCDDAAQVVGGLDRHQSTAPATVATTEPTQEVQS